MILQALTRYYEVLSADTDTAIAPPGYSTVGVSFALNLATNGELLDVYPLFVQEQRGNTLKEAPRRMVVPEQVKRAGSNPSPNFIWDNPTFVLGLSDKEAKDSDYALKRFGVFRQHNTELLAQADCDAARAVIAFLKTHDPLQAREHPVIAGQLEKLLQGGNLVFMFHGAFVHDDASIKRVWEQYKAGKDTVLGQCLVTGEVAPIARLHPSLKGIRGAQATGATLVGFNAAAYESFNRARGQGLNSPVSETATFAYSTALNYLLSSANPNRPIILGDTTVVYWAESSRPEYPAAFASFFGAAYMESEATPDLTGHKEAEGHLAKVARKVQRLGPLDALKLKEGLDESVRFYVLGLAPNAARISVRFFITEPFGQVVERIMQHYADLQIIKEYDNQPDYIPLDTILDETVSPKARNQEAAPLLAGALMRSILTGGPYPAALYYAIINRLRADMDDADNRIQKINYVRAAILKACLCRKYRRQTQHPFQEVLSMSLNETSSVPAYVLGRLFAVLEKVQREAVGDVGATIKDRYFTSACASPASVFPVLLRLSQHHIAKAEYGYASDNRIQDLLNLLDVEKNPFPARLSLDEQGIFVLGYYHQRAAFYAKKSDNNAQSAQPEN